MSADHKSFLKWAGGKIKLLPTLRELGIENGTRFIEPFVGSGVVSLNMPHKEIIISDTNEGLINLWELIAGISNPMGNNLNRCQEVFYGHGNDEASYYKARKIFNETKSGALFLYLNKHCFNGLCRMNGKGEFNVPFGKRKTAPAYPEKELLHAMEVSQKMTILLQGFEETFMMVKKGDMVYCDPPYIPLSKTSSFTKYSTEFGEKEQVALMKCAREAQSKGATVIISNNDCAFARDLYLDAEKHYIDVQKNISCKSDGRKKQREIIAVYRP